MENGMGYLNCGVICGVDPGYLDLAEIRQWGKPASPTLCAPKQQSTTSIPRPRTAVDHELAQTIKVRAV